MFPFSHPAHCLDLLHGGQAWGLQTSSQKWAEKRTTWGGNSLSRVFLLRFCEQINSSLAGALPSLFLNGFRPLEANFRKANHREKKSKQGLTHILHFQKCSPRRINLQRTGGLPSASPEKLVMGKSDCCKA